MNWKGYEERAIAKALTPYCDFTEQEADPLEFMQPEAQLTSVEFPALSAQTAFCPEDLHSPLLLPVQEPE